MTAIADMDLARRVWETAPTLITIWGDLKMNEPQDTGIEELKTEAPESADWDLSDEALDRPLGGGEYFGGLPLSLGCK